MKYLYVELNVDDSVKFERLIYHSEFSFDKSFEQAGHKVYRLPISDTMDDITECINIMLLNNYITPISLVIKENITEHVKNIEKNIKKMLNEAHLDLSDVYTDEIIDGQRGHSINGITPESLAKYILSDSALKKQVNKEDNLASNIDITNIKADVKWTLDMDATSWGIKSFYTNIKEFNLYIIYDILDDELETQKDLEIEILSKSFKEINTTSNDSSKYNGIYIQDVDVDLDKMIATVNF